jgi:quinol monooxygenase YgiN
MQHVLVRFKVQEYARWRAVFDENAPTRAAQGMGNGHVFRNSSDPNEIIIVLEVTDLQKARAFVESPELKQAQQRGGVIPPPSITWLNEEP